MTDELPKYLEMAEARLMEKARVIVPKAMFLNTIPPTAIPLEQEGEIIIGFARALEFAQEQALIHCRPNAERILTELQGLEPTVEVYPDPDTLVIDVLIIYKKTSEPQYDVTFKYTFQFTAETQTSTLSYYLWELFMEKARELFPPVSALIE